VQVTLELGHPVFLSLVKLTRKQTKPKTPMKKQ
jgi:hypothetical protein